MKSTRPPLAHQPHRGGSHGLLGLPRKVVRRQEAECSALGGRALQHRGSRAERVGTGLRFMPAAADCFLTASSSAVLLRRKPATSSRSARRPAEARRGGSTARPAGCGSAGATSFLQPSDPRTLLIDRGMLTQGLLTAEELAAMHQTGDEWAKYANRLEQIQVKAGQSADAAVEADRAARAEVKARKKAEAAERKKPSRRGGRPAQGDRYHLCWSGCFGAAERSGQRCREVDGSRSAGSPVSGGPGRRARTVRLAPAVALLPHRGGHAHPLRAIRRAEEDRRHANTLRSAPDACRGPAVDSGDRSWPGCPWRTPLTASFPAARR